MHAGTGTEKVGSALHAVLTLYRSPALRHVLRERPLPTDIELVMRLSAASQPLLNDTAAEIGETPATVIEAARFYLQQMLFEPGVDAYRILGVAQDAPPARIRRHYFWLQRWLHPDHNGENPESAFVVRLNWAWQRLRSESAREAYDAEWTHRFAGVGDVGIPKVVQRHSIWTTIPVPASERPRRWWRHCALGIAFCGGAMLLYAALARFNLSPLPSREDETVVDAESPRIKPEGMAAADKPLPQVAEPAVSVGASIAASDRNLEISKSPTERVVITAAAATQSRPESTQLPSTPASPAEKPVSLAVLSPVANTLPPKPVPPPKPVMLAAAKIPDSLPASAVITVSPPPTVPTTALSPLPAAPPASPTASVQAAVPPALSAAAAINSVTDAVLLQRVDLARKHVRLLVDYFGRTDSDVFPGDYAQSPFNAPLQRAALRERNGLSATINFALDTPVWHIDDEHVAMDAVYRVAYARDVIEHGRFSVRMIWRGDNWQITRIALEPTG